MSEDVKTHHPDYDEFLPDWTVMRDAAKGQAAVKGKQEEYLPMPSGFRAMPDAGKTAYDAYLTRAQFPEYTAPSIRGMVGVIHRGKAKIELPSALEGMHEKATADGLGIEELLRRITREVLTTGRYCLLGDFPVSGGEPFLAGYHAENLINWSDEQDFFVLDESGSVREEFKWSSKERYRVLQLDEQGFYIVRIFEKEGENLVEQEPLMPSKPGGRLTEIPFTTIGSIDLTTDPDEIPLLQVGRSALAEYRLDADYRHQLYMSGQETFVVSGVTEEQKPEWVGSGVVITLPEGGEAKYVGPTGVGISAHRTAIDSEREKAIMAGARLFEQDSREAESGDARRQRMAAQTATLQSVAMATAAGLEQSLKHLAEWAGANPDEVSVEPNLSFIDSSLEPAEAVNLMKLWMGGAISKRTLYENLKRGEIAAEAREFEEEEELIQEEVPDIERPNPDEIDDARGSGEEEDDDEA